MHSWFGRCSNGSHTNRTEGKMLLVQNNGEKQSVLIHSCRSTKITSSCWTTINQRTLKPTKKKKIPHPETKKKPQGDGRKGKNMIKSNPKSTGWVTHNLESNNTKEILLLLWRFWPSCQISQPGDLAKRLGIPGNLTLKASRICLLYFHRTRGNRLHSWMAQAKSCIRQDPRERSSDCTGDWTRSMG